MNHKHKLLFVGGLVFLGASCALFAGKIDPHISIATLPNSPTLRYPVSKPQDNGLKHAPATDKAPSTPDVKQKTANLSIRDKEIAAKPITKHASEILREENYPQESYFALATTPNDPYASQWPLTAISAPDAWDTTTGSSDIVIAVIDTGFGFQHEEFTDRWHTNPGETGTTSNGGVCWTGSPVDKSTNGCDDDANGYDDDWRGWDFFWSDNDPSTGTVSPDGSSVAHGTEVASLAAASANNSKGLAGMNWNAKIMPLQVLSDNGNGITYDVVAAIEYAARQGADVINLSLASTTPDAALQAAVRFAVSRNVTVVAAAGNCGNQPPSSCNVLSEPGNMTYPAIYDEVISVGALTQSNARASFSSYGSSLDIMAPGSIIPYSAGWTASNQTSLYATGISGTSFSSPIVAGLAALIRSIDHSLSPKDVRAILIDSSDRVAGMSNMVWTNQYGYGRVNALKALQLTQVRSTAIRSGPLPSNSKRPPIVSLSEATTAEAPASAATELIATCGSYMGDTCIIEFINITNAEKHTLDLIKTDSSGTAGWRFTPAQIGVGAGTWTVRAHGNSLSSESITFYVQ